MMIFITFECSYSREAYAFSWARGGRAFVRCFVPFGNDIYPEEDEPDFNPNKVIIATEVPVFFGPGGAAKAIKSTIVIGEGMARVSAYASKIGAQTIKMPQNILNMVDGPAKWSAMMAYNRQWIFQHVKNGSTIIDIGIDVNRPAQLGRSIYYQMEQNVIKYYNMLMGVK